MSDPLFFARGDVAGPPPHYHFCEICWAGDDEKEPCTYDCDFYYDETNVDRGRIVAGAPVLCSSLCRLTRAIYDINWERTRRYEYHLATIAARLGGPPADMGRVSDVMIKRRFRGERWVRTGRVRGDE